MLATDCIGGLQLVLQFKVWCSGKCPLLKIKNTFITKPQVDKGMCRLQILYFLFNKV